MIRAGAEVAVKRAIAGELSTYTSIPAPYEFEIELTKPMTDSMKINISSLDEFEIIDERHIATTAPDMDLGFRRVAYIGYADREGVTRY